MGKYRIGITDDMRFILGKVKSALRIKTMFDFESKPTRMDRLLNDSVATIQVGMLEYLLLEYRRSFVGDLSYLETLEQIDSQISSSTKNETWYQKMYNLVDSASIKTSMRFLNSKVLIADTVIVIEGASHFCMKLGE